MSSLALISDVHGNTTALDAVLDDIASVGGVDAIWALGDLVALGPDPVGVAERLTGLPNCSGLSGNTERYTLTGSRPLPTPEQAAERPHHPGLIASFSWAAGRLQAAGHLDWLASLPGHLRTGLSDGTTVVGVHATYGRDDGDGLHAGLTDGELDDMLDEAGADVLVGGHTHTPMLRTTSRGIVMNLGSVSNPIHADRRATYAIVRAGDPRPTIERRSVAYDAAAVLDQLLALRHPGTGWLEECHFAPER